MEVKVYLTKGGAEGIVNGRSLYSWDFGVTTEDLPQFGIKLATVEVELPEPKLAAEKAIAALEAELQATRANAYKEERELQERIAKLLALPAPEQHLHIVRSENDDIPF